MSDALPPREKMDFDIVIVGGGPAGLAAAIRLKQLAAEAGNSISIVILEKGAEIGAHILSGAVIDPVGLDRLLPEWRSDPERPLTTPVTEDRLSFLWRSGGMRIPHALMPPLLDNRNCFIGSLGRVTRWLAQKAEALGVEIYPGFAASEVIYEDGAVIGVATGDLGVGRDGLPGPAYTRGIALHGRYTLFAEGARGHLSKKVIARYALSKDRAPQKFGLGIKEIWQLAPDRHRPGLVEHSFGWPLDNATGGGSFLYHLDDGTAAVGYVVHLDYENPHLSPYAEFQRFKTHPAIRPTFEGGSRISYGARAIAEGGFQSVPKLVFPGGALLGCAAGFVNVPRIKGSHNAMLSGMLAAEHAFAALAAGRGGDELTGYEESWRASTIGRDLWAVRNAKPLWSRFGTLAGLALAGLDMWTQTLSARSPFGTLTHRKADHETLATADAAPPIAYPKPDGVVSFDLMSSVFLSNTNHEENQPPHLKILDPDLQVRSEFGVFGGPSAAYCPAGVYEWSVPPEPRLTVNAQNCVHCKTCDIKDPNQNIDWTAPEGGGGPLYGSM